MRLAAITRNVEILSEGKYDALTSMLNIPVKFQDGTSLSLLEFDDMAAAKDANYEGVRHWYDQIYEGLKHEIDVDAGGVSKRGPKSDRLLWFIRQYKFWICEELVALIDNYSAQFPSVFGTATEPMPSDQQRAVHKVIERFSGTMATAAQTVAAARGSTHVTNFAAAFEAIRALLNCGDMQHFVAQLRTFHTMDPNNALANVEWGTKPWATLKDELRTADREVSQNLEGCCPNPCPGVAGGAGWSRQDHPPHRAEKVVNLSGGWGWWDLHAPYCSVEGRSAQHCGNVTRKGSNDTILSLRKETKKKNVYEAFVTFIFENNGNLGEMKGRQNQKPDPKYHEAIAVLLAKHEPIKTVLGKSAGAGGHAPSSNFCLYLTSGSTAALNGWTDLNDQLAEELHEARPEIWHVGSTCYYCKNVHQMQGECALTGQLGRRGAAPAPGPEEV